MQVRWNRTNSYNEVSCNCAHHAAILLCLGHELLRIDKYGQKTIYFFRFETFQHFPRFNSDFNNIKLKIPNKKYFDTYRQLLDGNQYNFVNSEAAFEAVA